MIPAWKEQLVSLVNQLPENTPPEDALQAISIFFQNKKPVSHDDAFVLLEQWLELNAKQSRSA
ncbi:hypothetical protein [Chrysiogenes arsenatis]|uniref:hypothetical protein n=1 Tax=Chrysiogenes arsenatis TaxID=309797 RepID=UPI0003F876FE|nr:hypothetical protein [Chrysiogenes arsenatis]